MQRFSLILAFVGSLFSIFGFADMIDPSQLVKVKGDEYLATGDNAGEYFCNYMVDGEIRFRVIESLTGQVDEMIDLAMNVGFQLFHIAPTINYFYDSEMIEQNLVMFDGDDVEPDFATIDWNGDY